MNIVPSDLKSANSKLQLASLKFNGSGILSSIILVLS